MSQKLVLNLIYFIFLLFLVKSYVFADAQIPYAHSPHADSPQTKYHNSLPIYFLQNMTVVQKGHVAEEIFELKNYLSNLGYMRGKIDSNIFDNNLELGLKRYQLFFNLEQSGLLDNTTIQNLLKRRCGVPDIWHHESQLDNKNPLMVSHYTFLPNNPKWPPTKEILTYSFQPGTRGDVVQPIVRATAQWASVTHFKFNYVNDYEKADIKISFQLGDHGDGSPFDGTGIILAHAGGPLDGRIHYDGAENWVDGVAPDYYDLQTVGLHELGHVLGLGHSADLNSVMYPSTPANTRIDLTTDDIAGVRAIYQI